MPTNAVQENDWVQSVELNHFNESVSNILENETRDALAEKAKFINKVKTRKKAGFLLTGVIVHQSCRLIGYVSVGAAVGTTLAVGLASGPGGLAAAYLGVLSTTGPALAAVESASLTAGVAASFIPCLP